MCIKLLMLLLLIGQLGFTQITSYKAKYSYIKSMTLSSINDINSLNNDTLSMEAEIDVIANNKYALITTQLFKISNPIFQTESEQLILKNNVEINFVEYDTKTVYKFADNKAFTYLLDVYDTSNYVINIGEYTCNLYYEINKNIYEEAYNIWTSKTIPWYVNPGLFYSRKIGGIVKLDNSETVIELKKIEKISYDFKNILEKTRGIEKMKISESRLRSF